MEFDLFSYETLFPPRTHGDTVIESSDPYKICECEGCGFCPRDEPCMRPIMHTFALCLNRPPVNTLSVCHYCWYHHKEHLVELE